jgi:hypothetical protein
MSTLQNFINDFLQSTTDDDPTQAGMGPVAPAAPPPPPPPPQPAPQTGRSKKRARDGADETASERADRKSARERRRRAEVGEKFEELTKALGEAEERCAGSVPRRDAVSEGNRVDLLQRAIDVVRALTKACVDAKRAAAAAPAPAPPPPPPPPPEPVRLVVVAQTSVSRAQLADLARRGDAWHSAFEQRDGGAVAAVAGAASTAATSFVVGDGRTPLPPGPPTPQHLIPAQAPVAATPPVRAPGAAAPFAAAPLPASLSIPYPAALSLAPTQTGRPRAPSGGAASYFAPAAC